MHGVHRLPPATVDVKNAYVPAMPLDGAVLILKHRFPFSFQKKPENSRYFCECTLHVPPSNVAVTYINVKN